MNYIAYFVTLGTRHGYFRKVTPRKKVENLRKEAISVHGNRVEIHVYKTDATDEVIQQYKEDYLSGMCDAQDLLNKVNHKQIL